VPVCPVDEKGCFTAEIGDHAGQRVLDANKASAGWGTADGWHHDQHPCLVERGQHMSHRQRATCCHAPGSRNGADACR
jgi:hypothetical protein